MLRTAACAALAALALSGGLTASAADKDDLREARERVERLRKDLSQSESSRAEAADRLRASESAISEATRELHTLQATQREAQRELERIGSETAQLQATLDRGQAQLAALLYRSYVDGPQSPLKLLFSGEEQGAAMRLLTYRAHVARAQAALIDELRADMARKEALERDARARHEDIARLEAQQREQHANLATQVAERRKVLAEVSGRVTQQRKQMAVAQRNEARLARLVEALAKAARAKPKPAPPRAPANTARGERNERVPEAAIRESDFPTLKGRLRLPVRGELADRFGTPRQDSGLASKGVFIRAGAGEEVRAVASGEVVYADWMRGFGNLLILDHGGGYLTIYGNNEAVLKRPGETVRAGDVVATVGATGGNQAPGLYFEMRHLGRPFDPLPWVTLK